MQQAIQKTCIRMHYRIDTAHKEDLFYQILEKFFENRGKALHNFRGDHPDSIFVFLNTVIRHHVMNDMTRFNRTKRRTPLDKTDSLDAARGINSDGETIMLLELLDIHDGQDLNGFFDLRAAILGCISSHLAGKRFQARDTFIFTHYLFKQMLPNEIAQQDELQMLNDGEPLSHSRISNIITGLKLAVKKCLIENGYDDAR